MKSNKTDILSFDDVTQWEQGSIPFGIHTIKSRYADYKIGVALVVGMTHFHRSKNLSQTHYDTRDMIEFLCTYGYDVRLVFQVQERELIDELKYFVSSIEGTEQ